VDLASVSPKEPMTKALGWELVRLQGGGRQKARQGECLSRLQVYGSSTARRCDQPDHPHRHKPIFSVANLHMHSS
jgi:hypothetical protein